MKCTYACYNPTDVIGRKVTKELMRTGLFQLTTFIDTTEQRATYGE